MVTDVDDVLGLVFCMCHRMAGESGTVLEQAIELYKMKVK
jgi:hypothetical protein